MSATEMSALERAIVDPQPVAGIETRSPVDGLNRRSVGFLDVLAQSVSAVAPAAAATTMPLLVAMVAGGATVWALLAAMFLTLLVATTVNQFTRRIAATGSLYTFVAHGLGTTASFVTGVALLVGYGFVAMFALGGAGYYLAIVAARFWPALTGTLLVPVLLIVLMAAGCLYLLVRGIRVSTRATLLVECASVVIILGLVVALLVVQGPSLDWSVLNLGGAQPADFAVGAAIALTAFVGFESSATLGVEARRPYATIPRAVTWTVIGSGLLYLLAAFSQLVGFASVGGSITGSSSPVNDLSAAYGVDALGLLLDGGIAASFLACAIASITALVRVLFSMGREGLVTSAFGRSHPRHRTPYFAILVTVPLLTVALIGTILLAGGIWPAMQILIVGAAGGYITAYILTCVAAPVFLWRIDELTLWPLVRAAAATVLLSAVLVVYIGVEATSTRSAGVWVFLAVLAAGTVFAAVRHRRRPWLRNVVGIYDVPVTGDILGTTGLGDRAAP